MTLALLPSAFLSAIGLATSAHPGPGAFQEPAAEPSEERQVDDGEAVEGIDPEFLETLKAIGELPWVEGPTTGDLGRWARVEVPEGLLFVGAEGARKYLELNGNTTDGDEFGLVCSPDHAWFAVYEFEECGYVEDDEKAELDEGEILESLRENQERANEELRSLGLPTLEILGWMTPPHYDAQTQNLEWATRARSSDGGTSANLNTRLLGRHGVMSATLVASPEDLELVLPDHRRQLAGFSFKPGERYTEFSKGDRVAEYGLTGLIAGGVGVAAVKSGLLGKLWKVLVAAAIALVAGAKKLFGGKKAASRTRATRVRAAPASAGASAEVEGPPDAGAGGGQG